jgi:hypothetical protein
MRELDTPVNIDINETGIACTVNETRPFKISFSRTTTFLIAVCVFAPYSLINYVISYFTIFNHFAIISNVLRIRIFLGFFRFIKKSLSFSANFR